MSQFITKEILDEYRANGVVCLRNVFDNYWIERVTQGIETNLKNPSIYSEKLMSEGESGAYFNDYCNWNSNEHFKEYVYKSAAAQIAGLLMESDNAVFYHEHVLVKDPGTTKETPWHNDQPYYPIDGFKVFILNVFHNSLLFSNMLIHK
jgi:ectoine hydroxylase-related dioxygenase (phytanoyl-CoA dioxygenase family)